MSALQRTGVFSAVMVGGLLWGVSGFGEQLRVSELMSAEEFREAGLHKLTDEEQEKLDHWLTGRFGGKKARASSKEKRDFTRQEEFADTAEGAIAASRTDQFGSKQVKRRQKLEQEREETRKEKKQRKRNEKAKQENGDKVDRRDGRESLQSRIVGNFRGWRGQTRFHLENGQVWEQRFDDYYQYKGEANPRVEIIKFRFGYTMRLSDYGVSLGVKRIE